MYISNICIHTKQKRIYHYYTTITTVTIVAILILLLYYSYIYYCYHNNIIGVNATADTLVLLFNYIVQ